MMEWLFKEKCSGCGIRAESHPIAGITSKRGKFIALPVCDKCWRDPSNRKNILDASFFERKHQAVALANAGSSTLGL
jgi:hypothetical protein